MDNESESNEIAEVSVPKVERKELKVSKAIKEEMISFEEWYSLRKTLIPAHHHQEILVADFKGQKVPMVNTMAKFDEALNKYGVKLV
jgi:hypothetical protein